MISHGHPGASKTMEICRLCQRSQAIENSHVTPSFVYRAIKFDSPTGFLRNPTNPNRRVQDGDKLPLLCAECEQRFGKCERQIAENIFEPFHANDQDEFTYGPWLHYFATSLAWRALILDLPGLIADSENPRSIIERAVHAEERMRTYLLGATSIGASLNNHLFMSTKVTSADAILAAAGPNWMTRRSVFGYTVIDQKRQFCGILHNLAGLMFFFIIKGNPRDLWRGTKISPIGGKLTQPQQVSSWLAAELLNCVAEHSRFQENMSPNQRKIVADAVGKASPTRALRFRELDKTLNVET